MSSCYICGKQATQLHHRFPQYKRYKKLYPNHIHHPDNLMDICENCHLTKPVEHWTEKEFCEFFNIEIKSKSGQKVLTYD